MRRLDGLLAYFDRLLQLQHSVYCVGEIERVMQAISEELGLDLIVSITQEGIDALNELEESE